MPVNSPSRLTVFARSGEVEARRGVRMIGPACAAINARICHSLPGFGGCGLFSLSFAGIAA